MATTDSNPDWEAEYGEIDVEDVDVDCSRGTLADNEASSSSSSSLELSDGSSGDGRWRAMDVRSSTEPRRNLARPILLALTLAAIASAAGLAFAFYREESADRGSFEDVLEASTTTAATTRADAWETSAGDDGEGTKEEELVPPLLGLAHLTPDEIRDVRPARPGESVLVTGGLGFIGSHVVDLLLHRGFAVTILDDESNGHNHNGYAREWVPKDITVRGDLPAYPAPGGGGDGGGVGEEGRFTHVVHLAAAISVSESMSDPDKYERINYEGSRRVLEWIEGYNRQVSNEDPGAPTIRKLVAASSAAVYGDPDPALLPLRETAPYGGLSPYADTKYRMEGLMRAFVDAQNAPTAREDAPAAPPAAKTGATALRFFNVYGPRQDPKNPYSGVISLFLEMALGNRDVTVLGDGEMTRDFVYVKDVARAVVLALLQEDDSEEEEGKEAEFDVYNVCTGRTMTINELAARVKQSMGSTSKVTHLDPREGDIRESSCNPSKARGGIGFEAAVTQEAGLEKTAAWFRSEGGGKR